MPDLTIEVDLKFGEEKERRGAELFRRLGDETLANGKDCGVPALANRALHSIGPVARKELRDAAERADWQWRARNSPQYSVLVEAIDRWRNASRHEAVGMGSASGMMIASTDAAKLGVVEAIKRDPQNTAKLLDLLLE